MSLCNSCIRPVKRVRVSVHFIIYQQKPVQIWTPIAKHILTKLTTVLFLDTRLALQINIYSILHRGLEIEKERDSNNPFQNASSSLLTDAPNQWILYNLLFTVAKTATNVSVRINVLPWNGHLSFVWGRVRLRCFGRWWCSVLLSTRARVPTLIPFDCHRFVALPF